MSPFREGECSEDSSCLSNFQVECTQRALKVLERFGVTVEQTRSGVHEEYIVISAPRQRPRLEIFIYTNEAGFFYGKSWYIWESQDYPRVKDLMKEFLAGLEEKLKRRSE